MVEYLSYLKCKRCYQVKNVHVQIIIQIFIVVIDVWNTIEAGLVNEL